MQNSSMPRRVFYAQNIVNEVMKNPDAAVHFVCNVADEVSMVELERIYTVFFHNLKTIHQKTNLNN